jgi:acyl-CoA dehydrogenase
VALARDYAFKREAFGRKLAQLPLHVDTLAGLQAELEGALHLTFRAVELLGRLEMGELDAHGGSLLRVLVPLAKLTTARQAVTVTSECVEAFGGAGYVEDTGLPVLLRDAQVLSIWEGTTNVLALDVLRALDAVGGMKGVRTEVERCAQAVKHVGLAAPLQAAQQAVQRAERWLADATANGGRAAVETGARRFALTLGRGLELALLVHHAQWAHDQAKDPLPAAAARRLAAHGVDLLTDVRADDAALLAREGAGPG